MIYKDLKSYFKTIKKLLPIYGKNEKRFLNDFQQTVEEYIKINADYNMNDIIDNFQDPKCIVADYINTIDSDYLSKHLKKARLIRIVSIAAFTFLLFSFMINIYLDYKSYVDFKSTIPTVEETVIQYNK